MLTVHCRPEASCHMLFLHTYYEVDGGMDGGIVRRWMRAFLNSSAGGYTTAFTLFAWLVKMQQFVIISDRTSAVTCMFQIRHNLLLCCQIPDNKMHWVWCSSSEIMLMMLRGILVNWFSHLNSVPNTPTHCPQHVSRGWIAICQNDQWPSDFPVTLYKKLWEMINIWLTQPPSLQRNQVYLGFQSCQTWTIFPEWG